MHKNENRPGYKKTKVGWIPEDWKYVSLGDISRVVRGGSPRPAGSPLFFNGDYIPWITVAELTNDKGIYLSKTKSCLTKEGANRSRIFPPGSLLLANSGATLGVPKITTIEACANDGIAGFFDLSDNVNKLFIYYFLTLKTKYLRECLAPGIGQPNLNTELISSLKAPFPPLPEQKAIAEVLECWDKGIVNLELKIVKKRNIKKGLMQALLSGKIRLPGFGKTHHEGHEGNEGGNIPEGWRVIRLGEVGEFSKGKGISRKDVVENGFPCIRYGEIYTTEDFVKISFNSYITKETSHSSKPINRNTLLLAGSGETVEDIGKALAYMGEEKAYAGGDIVIFKPEEEKARADYLSYYLNTTGRRRIQRLGQGQSVVHVYSRDLTGMVVTLPQIEEQNKIISIFANVESEIVTLGKKMELLKDQKKYLLNNLVTGTIRLPAFRKDSP
mgnify:CR=1 FL=1